jgi:transposase
VSNDPSLENGLRKVVSDKTRAELEELAVRVSLENVELREKMQRLFDRIEALEERLGTNSSNSDQPPSSDRPGQGTRHGKPPTGKRKGGQPGHPGKMRQLVATDKVDRLVTRTPSRCFHCEGTRLSPSGQDPVRHQVWELPPEIRCLVTEYQLHVHTCADCGGTTEADLPLGVSWSSFGPRLHALVGLLSGVLGGSDRPIQEFLQQFLTLDISLGAVAGIRRRLGQALKQPHAEGLEHVRAQEAVHADETSWRESGRLVWLWTAVTSLVSVFMIQAGRTQECARNLFGNRFVGTAICDRLGSYSWLPNLQRCWAHLIRTFHRIAGRRGRTGRIGQRLEKLGKEVLIQWRRVRKGELARSTFRARARLLRHEILGLLRLGVECGHAKTQGICKAVLRLEPQFWLFPRVEGVEPTNNAAERALRRPVIWRKTRYGTHSEAGSRWVERILTVVTSLRQQHRRIYDYLVDACSAHFRELPAPSLLPA